MEQGTNRLNIPETTMSVEEIREYLKLFRRTTMNDPEFRRFRRMIQEKNAQQLHMPLKFDN
ncbi:MAG: hypothetical protein K6C94_07520 [Candidatus Gastranaerophilales bacterium]|nr:hypothetical protein [Candidatus Gastranaerophilales bacterium]